MTAATRQRAAVPGPADHSQEEITGYVRSPSDVLRTVVFSLVTLLLVLLARGSRDALLSLETDLVRLLSFLHPTTGRILAGASTLLVIASLAAAWITALVTRRYCLFGHLLVSGLLAAMLLQGIDWFLDRGSPDVFVREIARRQGGRQRADR